MPASTRSRSIELIAAASFAAAAFSIYLRPPDETRLPEDALPPFVGNIHTIASQIENNPSPSDLADLLRSHLDGNTPDDEYARDLLIPILVAKAPTTAVSLARTSKQPDVITLFLSAFNLKKDNTESFELGRRVLKNQNCPPAITVSTLALLATGLPDDFQAAMLAISNTDPETATKGLDDALISTLEFSPEKAIADALELIPRKQRYSSIRNLFRKWAESDPAAAWAAISGVPAEISKRGLQSTVIDRWFDTDPSAAAAFFTQPGNKIDEGSISSLTRALFKHDPAIASKWARDLQGSPHSQDIFEDLGYQIGQSSPKQALEAIAQGIHLEAPNPARALKRLVDGFAGESPLEALEWAKTYQGRDRMAILEEVIDRTASKKPEETFAFIESGEVPPEKMKNFVYELGELATHDLPRYLELFADAPEDLANQAISSAVRQLADDDDHIQEARDIFSQTGLTEKPIENAAQRAVTRWATDRPAETAEWVTALQPGFGRNHATQNLVDQWARHDQAGATAYAQSLPPESPERQHAAYALAERLAAASPKESLQWLQEISTDKELTNSFLSSNGLSSLIYHVPDQLQQLFPENESLTKKIEADQAWRTYFRNYTPGMLRAGHRSPSSAAP